MLLCYFILINTTTNNINSIQFNSSSIEILITLLSISLLIIIISPSLIIILDYDSILIPSIILYSIGYQWAWNFNLYISSLFITFIDQRIIPFSLLINNKIIINNNNELINNNNKIIINNKNIINKIINNNILTTNKTTINKEIIHNINKIIINNRLLINNELLILPLYSIIKLFILSYDVIHSLSYYSLGIKIDAIPSRINISNSIRPLIKGEYRGYCFELCGQGHTVMILSSIILINNI